MSKTPKPRFLIVDDVHEILQVIGGLLKSLGISVETATDGSIAWQKIQDSEFDIILTDIRMPIMNGVELLKKIREVKPNSPCVFITSGYNDYPVDELFNLGANGFLPKPVSASSIRSLINKAFQANEERWKLPRHDDSAESIALEFASFSDMVHSKAIRFGNGGFTLRINRPNVFINSSVKFLFTFQNGPIPSIEGMGVIRWVHEKAGQSLVGIEIEHLTDPCRKQICTWLREQNFKTFIPGKS